MAETAQIFAGAKTTWPWQICPEPHVARRKSEIGKGNRDRLPLDCGGEEEDRTPDLCIANAALSQLSYFPMEPVHYSGIVAPSTNQVRFRQQAARISAAHRVPFPIRHFP